MSNAERLRSADRLDGVWSVVSHVGVLDAAASVGPDFLCLDTQHGDHLASLNTSHFTSLVAYGVAGLVRVDSMSPVPIGLALDLGAAGIIVPQIDDAAEAKAVVAATAHMPSGHRSFGMQTRRLGPFDEKPYVVIQIETADALANVDGIAGVEGVDCLYIGPADLALSLGGSIAEAGAVFEGTAENAEMMRDAFGRVLEACRANGIAPGLHCRSGAAAARAHQEGFAVTAVTTDMVFLASGLAAELEAARGSV